VSHTFQPPFSGRPRNARIRRSKVRRDIWGRPDELEYDADKLASVCGEMDRTGVRCLLVSDVELEEAGLDEMKERTSLCDWRVMSKDSVEVMQPLLDESARSLASRGEACLQARQSFRLISAFSNAFLP